VTSSYLRRRAGLPIAIVVLAALAAGPAAAKTITVGPEKLGMTTPGKGLECATVGGCTVTAKTPSYTSPVDGAIVKWRVKGSEGSLTLRVLKGNKGGSGFAFGNAESKALQTFTPGIPVPIKTGERFGVDLPSGSGHLLGQEDKTDSEISYWTPILKENETSAPKTISGDHELLLNVEIQPAPTVTSVAPTAGTAEEVNTVTIKGKDFTGDSSVEFGTYFATSEVKSESEIVAEVYGFKTGTVPVKVTTAGGTGTLAGAYTFNPKPPYEPPVFEPIVVPPIVPIDLPPLSFDETHCLVPKLKGEKIKAAKKAVRAAHCLPGSVTYKHGKNAKTGRVLHESPPPDTETAPGHPVNLRLG
jgi:IPT/TIG domain